MLPIYAYMILNLELPLSRWSSLRQGEAPDFIPPSVPSAEDEALDWELTSLVTKSEGFHGPIVYERNHVHSDKDDSSEASDEG